MGRPARRLHVWDQQVVGITCSTSSRLQADSCVGLHGHWVFLALTVANAGVVVAAAVKISCAVVVGTPAIVFLDVEVVQPAVRPCKRADMQACFTCLASACRAMAATGCERKGTTCGVPHPHDMPCSVTKPTPCWPNSLVTRTVAGCATPRAAIGVVHAIRYAGVVQQVIGSAQELAPAYAAGTGGGSCSFHRGSRLAHRSELFSRIRKPCRECPTSRPCRAA